MKWWLSHVKFSHQMHFFSLLRSFFYIANKFELKLQIVFIEQFF